MKWTSIHITLEDRCPKNEGYLLRLFMLDLVPVTLKEANAFVALHHRHHLPVVGHKFSLGITDGSKIRGVCIVGRPVSRHLDNGATLEVNRCCTDGVKNGCSMLYGAAWRAAKAMGYKKLLTYTLPQEGGASLRAAGWICIGEAGGGNWNVNSRPRVDTREDLQQLKLRWETA
jgi:hypothetical protein